MATAKKHTAKGLQQDRKLVAGKQPYEVKYEAKKLGVKPAAVKAEIKKVGNSRAKIEKDMKK
jgi:Mn-dependent DtxR family transcriptional regulator